MALFHTTFECHDLEGLLISIIHEVVMILYKYMVTEGDSLVESFRIVNVTRTKVVYNSATMAVDHPVTWCS